MFTRSAQNVKLSPTTMAKGCLLPYNFADCQLATGGVCGVTLHNLCLWPRQKSDAVYSCYLAAIEKKFA